MTKPHDMVRDIGVALILFAIAFNMPYAWLAMNFHYPEILRQPPSVILSAFVGGGTALVLACPLTSETAGFLDARRIAQLPDGAIVVNIARGGVVDDDALIAALIAGKLAAAGLDVFNNEPRLDPRYYDLPQAFILPHIGSSTREARLGMAKILLDGFEALAAGQPVSNRLV